jgi:competence protein ComEC
VGFQLSYVAVAGIVWLQQPIYRSLYIKHWIVRNVWNMIAVTVAAQIAAFPLCIYYFNQFPNYFLLTNLIAVPLSTVILFCGIILISFSWISVLADYMGLAMTYMIRFLNFLINKFNSLEYSMIENIYADIYTTAFLYSTVFFVCCLMIYRSKRFFWFSITFLSLFIAYHVVVNSRSGNQQKIIVYNVLKSQSIDFIKSNHYYYVGDSIGNNVIKPSRIRFKVSQVDSLPGLQRQGDLWIHSGIRLYIIDTSLAFVPLVERIRIDILVISRNPTLKIVDIVSAIKPSIIIFDASNSLWKIAKWKKECSALLLPFHSVTEKGGFVFNIP